MTLEGLFSLASSVVMPGWLLLVFVPRWKWTTRLVAGVLIPGLLALIYLYLIATHWAGSEGGFSSLAEVKRLFENDALLLAGWVHYLGFDLFVGTWEVRDALKAGLPHLALVPCLVLTFLFGPIGLLLYFVLRGTLRKRLLLEDA